MKILIKNGRVLDPKNNIDCISDVLIADQKIIKIGQNIPEGADKIIDASGKWVTPGLVDMHTHLRDPGMKHKESIATGTRAAAAGGFTTITSMPNTSPVTDNDIVAEYITSKACKEGIVNVLPVGAITKNMDGNELSAIGEMKDAGICAISEDGKTVANPALMKTAMKYAANFDLPVLSHCEEIKLAAGQMNAGPTAEMLGFKGIGNDSEELIVVRDIILARGTGVKLHICHVSTAESLEHIRAAQAKGQTVTAEVCPHHFSLADEDIKDYDANCKMSPPLRSRKDVAALKAALKDGTISVIATDHAPHHLDDKNCEFEAAANGIIGLETCVPLSLNLVHEGILTPLQLIEKLTINPSQILGIDKGTLKIGATADITIINPDDTYIFTEDMLYGRSKNTPFIGQTMKGRVTHTIVDGMPVFEEGAIL